MKVFLKIIFVFIFVCVGFYDAVSQTDTSKTDMTFDFGLTRSRNIRVWPLVVRTKTPDYNNLQILFSIYGYKKEFKSHKVHTHLLPLYWKTKDSLSSDLRFLTIYYPSLISISKNKTADSLRSFKFFDLAPQINFMEITKSTNGTFVQNNLFFFIWYKNNRELNKMYFVTFPLYWSFKNPERTSSTFVPLYSYGRFNQQKGKYLAVTPLFWHINNGNLNKNVLFPLWWNKKTETDAGISTSNVIFPIIWSSKTPARNTFTFFPLFSRTHSRIYKNDRLMLTPLFWHVSNNSESSNILFPIWWQKQSKTGSNPKSSNVVFPVYWYKKDNYSEKEIVFPIVWSIKNSEYQSLTFFPLFSRGFSPDKSKSHLTLSPLFWKIKDGEDIQNILFPIFWANRNQNIDNKTLFPIIWSRKNPAYHSFTFFPVFSKGQSTDSMRSHLMLSPFLWRYKDHDLNLNLLLPIAWQKKTGVGENQKIKNVLFPIYWSIKTQYVDNKILFPVIWSLKNSYYQSFTFLPLFSKGHSADNTKSHLMLTPLLWRFKDHDSNLNLLLPIAWQKKTGTGENQKIKNVLFPIYWSNKTQYIDNKLLFPIIYSLKNPYYHSFSFIPLFSIGHSPDSTKNHLMLTPLFWHFKNNDSKLNLFMPVAWQKKSGIGEDKKISTVIFPIFWAKKDKFYNNKILFPVILSLKNPYYNSFTFFPLFSSGNSSDSSSSHLVISPLFWHFNKKNENKDVFFPLWWHYKTGNGTNTKISNVVFPLYWAKKNKYRDNKVLFPLVWSLKNPSYHSFTFFPLFSKGHSTDSISKHMVITPLFWHIKNNEGSFNVFFPFGWQKIKGSGENQSRFNAFIPLYWAKNDNNHNNKIVFPLVWSLKNKSYHSLTIIPFFSRGHSTDSLSEHLMLTPLFWHLKNENYKKNVFFPIWWQKSTLTGENKRITNYIFPLYYSKKDKEQNNKIFFPFVWSLQNSKYHSFTLFPLFSNGHSTDRKSSHLMLTPLLWEFQKENSSLAIIFPFSWIKKKKTDDGDHLTQIIFPIYWAKTDKYKNNRVLFPIMWSLKNRNYHSFTIFPLFSKGHSTDSIDSHLAILPLFWHFKKNELANNIFFPLWWQKEKGSGDNTCISNYILPIYWSKKDKNHNEKVLFPIIWRIKNPYYNSFTFVPLFSKGLSPDSSKAHLMITPFFSHFKKGNDIKNTFFPIWWQKKTGLGEDRKTTNYVFPVYWSKKDKYQNNKVLFPIIWNLKNPYYNSFTFAPLFSQGHSADNTKAHRMLTPLFWHFKNENKIRNIFFPLWWQKKTGIGEDRKTTNYIFPLYWSRKDLTHNNKILFPIIFRIKDFYSQSFTIFPLFSAGHKLDFSKRHLVVTPLFWNTKNGNIQRTTLIPLFYYYANSKDNEKRFNILYFLARYKNQNERKTFSLLWPLCESIKDDNYKYFRFAPIIWFKKSLTSNYFSIQPFYFQSNDSIGSNKRIFWELFTYKNIHNIKTSRNILWKALIWDKYNNTDHEFRIFYFLYANVNKSGYKEKGIFPFFSFKKESNGSRSNSIFLSFYNSSKRLIPNTSEYYMEDKIFWIIRIRSNYKALEEKGLKYK